MRIGTRKTTQEVRIAAEPTTSRPATKTQSRPLTRDGFDTPTKPYVVQEGDTLIGIADRFKTTVPAILQANPSLKNPDSIVVGTTLQIPVVAVSPPQQPANSTTTYQVQPGDSLTSIAARHATTMATLVALNPSIDPDVLQPGQVLVVPGTTATATPGTSTPGSGGTAGVRALPVTARQQSVVNLASGELQAWQSGTVERSSYYPAGGYGTADHAWCADFVSHVYQEAGLPLGDLQYPTLSGSASAPRLADWFAAGSATSDPYRIAIPANDPANPPRAGDVLFLGPGPSTSSITHTAIVTKVYADGSFDTIEGNIGGTNDFDGVMGTRHYTAEDRDLVYGFGRRLPPEPRQELMPRNPRLSVIAV